MILTDKQKTRLKLLYQKHLPEIKDIQIDAGGFITIQSNVPICFAVINKIKTEFEYISKKEKERKHLHNLKKNKFKRR